MSGSGKSGPVRVGVAGLGRSGRNIHLKTMEQLPEDFRVVAVFDGQAERGREVSGPLGCRAYDDYDQFLVDGEVALVVVAGPSHLHSEWSVRALEAGRDVLCEKPMAADLAGADAMIAAEKRSGRTLAIFQNMRYDPVFLKVKEIVDSGVLGRVNLIRRCMHMFRRRWDWQTVRRFGGGSIRNSGAHALDQLMHFTDPLEPEVFCRTDRVLTCGDAEDFAKVILTAPGRPLIDLEISPNCASPQASWLVTGERGSLEVPPPGGAPRKVILRLAQGLEASESREAPAEPIADGEYMQDNPEFEEQVWEDSENLGARGCHLGYYRHLAATLREGAPLRVTTESVRRRMVVIEECLR